MKVRRQTTMRGFARGVESGFSRRTRLALTTLAALLVAPGATLTALAASGTDGEKSRVEIVLDVAKLPTADREAALQRISAIADARSSKTHLFRSYDPRETLSETLAMLAANGADLGAKATINFDTIEMDVPVASRAAIEALPFVARVRQPVAPTQAGTLDSDALEVIGSDLANTAGITGAGVTVALIDMDYEHLDQTVAEGDLPTIPGMDQFEQTTAAVTTFINPADLDSITGSTPKREHGTAAAEVVHEVAPDATLILYAVKSVAGIEAAIRHAADRGANVILVPLVHIETMSEPKSLLVMPQGGNRFTDDIDYATAAGAVVVVAAGNEAQRHVKQEFTYCPECTDDDICWTANNDTRYHKFTDEEGFLEMPLNQIEWNEDYDFCYFAEPTSEGCGAPFTLTCTSAIEPEFLPNSGSSRWDLELWRFDDDFDAEFDFPGCPRDGGMNLVDAVPLGNSITTLIDLLDNEDDDQSYFIAVRKVGNPAPANITNFPEFRVNCTISMLGFVDFWNEGQSLSDLAVVESAISVAESDLFPDFVSEISSRGPSNDPSGPMKPDVTGPGTVFNFTTEDFFFGFGTFDGTSAASAHVAGIVALMKARLAEAGVPALTPEEIKDELIAAAIDIEEDGPDPLSGHGFVQVPEWVITGEDVPGSVDPTGGFFVEPGNACGGNTVCNDTIQEGFNAVTNGETLQVAAGLYAENASFDKLTTDVVVLQGGWNSDFTARANQKVTIGDTARPGETVVNKIIIMGGTVRVE